ALRRRAADALHQPGADEQAEAAAPRRAVAGAGASGGGDHLPHPPGGERTRGEHPPRGAERAPGAEPRPLRLRARDRRGGDAGRGEGSPGRAGDPQGVPRGVTGGVQLNVALKVSPPPRVVQVGGFVPLSWLIAKSASMASPIPQWSLTHHSLPTASFAPNP